MTGEKVDYHLLVNKFKDLNIEISEFPKKKIFWFMKIINKYNNYLLKFVH